jgi:folylpolyglutamate synthase/dihydropteroate synthase
VAAAVVAVETFFGRPTTPRCCSAAWRPSPSPAASRWSGRQPLVILDGAHNPAGAHAAAITLDDFDVPGSRFLVVGLSRAVTPSRCSRCWPSGRWSSSSPAPPTTPGHARSEVAAAAEAVGVEAVVAKDVGDALLRAGEAAGTDDLILVTGSLYVVGEARRRLGVSARAPR